MRLHKLPRLGVGISAEFESYRKGIDAPSFAAEHPGLVHFLEYGGDLQRGLDDQARRWSASQKPATYHFLDLNLEEPEDLDPEWLGESLGLARTLNAAWLCGDAGLWHFGPRDRGHQTLMPPVLCRDSAYSIAEAVSRLEEQSGLVCLPENPPGVVYLGPLHVLDFFALVSERSGCGLLLDLAHLAIFQRLRGLSPLTGLDSFPLDRVVELHVAGGVERSVQGFSYVEDLHAPEPLPETWQLLSYVLPRAPNLRAIVYECEMNQPEEVLENFKRLNQLFPVVPSKNDEALSSPAVAPLSPREALSSRPALASSRGEPTQEDTIAASGLREVSQVSKTAASGSREVSQDSTDAASRAEDGAAEVPHRAVQRLLVRVLYDPGLLQKLPAEELGADWVRAVDPRALLVDPLRRRKTLRPLVEELRTSASLALEEVRSLAWLEDGFFTSPEFHAAVQGDQPLVLALVSFLRSACAAGVLGSRLLPEVLSYEEARARARRVVWSAPGPVARVSEGAMVERAPGVLGLVCSVDVIAAVQAVERYLFELSLMPQAALCGDGPRPSLDKIGTEGTRYLVIAPGAEGPELSNGDAGLCALLEATARPVLVRELAAVLVRYGVPARNVVPLVESLAADGLLRVTPEPPRAVTVSPLRLSTKRRR